MIKFNMKPLVIALGLGVISLSASAHLASTRTVLNSTDSAVVTVNFAQPVSGDLYLATNVNGALVFFADQGKALTNKVLPFKSNGVFEGSLKVLDVSALGIPPNQYPLYEVVTAPGADPLNFNNWIGGLGGLHKLNFTIGLPVAVSNDRNGDGFSDDDNDHDGYRDGVIDTCKAVARDGKDDHNDGSSRDDDNESNDGSRRDDDHGSSSSSSSSSSSNCTPAPTTSPLPTTTPVPTISPLPTMVPVPVIPPLPTMAPVPTLPPVPTVLPVVNTANGQALYKSLTCSTGGCHTANPAANKNKLLSGKSLASLRSAIAKNPGEMGFLSSTSDADLQAVADYLKTF